MAVKRSAAIVLVTVLAGCETGDHPASSPARTPNPTPRIVVTHDNANLPRRCGVKRAVSWVVDFTDAFNRGDAARLDRLIADRQHLQWYSSNAGGGKRSLAFSASGLTSAVPADSGPLRHTDGRPALMRYLASRSKAGERMRVVQVKVSRVPPRSWFPSITDEVAGVEFEVMRSAPDFASLPGSNRLATGKGGFGCSDGRLLAWSMGLNTANGRPAHRELLCRRAAFAVRAARRGVIACSD